MARKTTQQLAYTALRIEGGLIPAEELTRLTTLAAPEATEQTEGHYDIPKGLKLRDEIARYFKIAQNLWQDFAQQRQRQDANPHSVTVQTLLLPLLRQVLGYTDLTAQSSVPASGNSHHTYNIGHAALGGRLPVVLAGFDQPLDLAAERFGDTNPETGRTRRRSPYMLAQEALNASDQSLWAVTSNGLKLRILRDNPSLTRPAYVEVDLEAIFTEELYADFTAFWLLAHASRFGKTQQDGTHTEPTDCPWERWRSAGQKSGETVRMNLRFQVEHALRSLGTGFLSHTANSSLREKLQNPEQSSATRQAFFEELLSLVYRFIFLATVEDRTDPSTGRSLIFTPDATEEQQQRYWQGYSLTWLRERAVRRSSHDTHSDLWQALSITFSGLATGQAALGLPALGGLFAQEQCPLLNQCQIDNRHLLAAVFQLGYFRQSTGLTRVNYRDMGAEELGSVYESLLELVPDYQHLSQPHAARLAFVGDEDDASNKGNARKLTGSYYTPDSLVQELIKSALEPVIAQTVQANPSNPVNALLELTVCDPACGSGHFLLAAARRLADEVAKLRAAAVGGAPTPADYRHALRDVVGHCIYGVDKNPMAIALAKTALWLEAYTSDRPLTFLDAHLRCGDALLGILDDSILHDGIPDKAFNALSGDDKDVVKCIKKANRDALKAIAKVKEKSSRMLSLKLGEVFDAATFEALPDDTLDALKTKRAAYDSLQASVADSKGRLAADIFVAAFVLPKTKSTEALVPTSQDLWLVLNGDSPRAGIAESAHAAAQASQAFHWWQAFPQVKAKGGFDVLLGNPPWERIKLQEEEFFATRSPLVGEAQHKAERGRRISLLAEGMLLHSLYPEVEAAQGLVPPNSAEQALYAGFLTARRNAEAASLFAHDAGRYPLTGVGDVNTYALFAETFAQLMADTGRAGFIVPTGIATDDGTKAFFAGLTQAGRLASLYDIENRERLFPAVDSRMKFCLLTLGRAEFAAFVCFATLTSQLADSRRRFTLTPDEFRLINPNTLTCPVFRSERDAALTKKLYRTAPVLVNEGSTQGNPWGLRFHSRLFHMAEDSHLFRNAPAAGLQPLYEAKMVHHFDHRWATYVGSNSVDVSNAQKQNPDFSVTSRYWVEATEVEDRLSNKGWERGWLMGWRDICRSTDERTVIASVVPRVAVGNKIPLFFPAPSISPAHAAALLCNLSSLALDFVARQKIGGTTLNYFYVKQFPVLPPERYTPTDLAYIVPRVLELTHTAHDMQAWADDLLAALPSADPRPPEQHGTSLPPFPWNPERRAQLRAELDAYYARLYGLTRDELRYILDPADVMGEDYPSETFRVLKKNEIQEFGEYRTQRLVLDAWDQLANLSSSTQPLEVAYSPQGMIRSAEEGALAGLVMAVVAARMEAVSLTAIQSALAGLTMATHYLGSVDGPRFEALQGSLGITDVVPLLSRILPIVQRLEAIGVLVRSTQRGEQVFARGSATPPREVIALPEHTEAARLLWLAEERRSAMTVAQVDAAHDGPKATGTQ